MALLGPAALVTLRRAAGGGGGARPCRDPPGVLRIASLSSAPPEPAAAATEPFAVELRAGKKYAWCACGHSKSQPFCDGAHRTAAPGVSPLRFTAEEDKRVWLCGCKRTRTPPYCDGTHKEGAVQSPRLPPKP
ncbi:CDGSH iron-sulfur domain-containing protein 3, mitochondrial [Aegotheles albertisi]